MLISAPMFHVFSVGLNYLPVATIDSVLARRQLYSQTSRLQSGTCVPQRRAADTSLSQRIYCKNKETIMRGIKKFPWAQLKKKVHVIICLALFGKY